MLLLTESSSVSVSSEILIQALGIAESGVKWVHSDGDESMLDRCDDFDPTKASTNFQSSSFDDDKL